MAKKTRLETIEEPATAFIGIASAMPVHKLVHYINQQTFLNFKCEKDIGVYLKKIDEIKPFAFYHSYNDDYRTDFSLVPNSSEGFQIFSALRQLNYFLIINGAIPDLQVDQLIANIKRIVGIQLVILFDQNNIAGLQSVLQELEMHLSDLNRELKAESLKIIPSAERQ